MNLFGFLNNKGGGAIDVLGLQIGWSDFGNQPPDDVTEYLADIADDLIEGSIEDFSYSGNVQTEELINGYADHGERSMVTGSDSYVKEYYLESAGCPKDCCEIRYFGVKSATYIEPIQYKYIYEITTWEVHYRGNEAKALSSAFGTAEGVLGPFLGTSGLISNYTGVIFDLSVINLHGDISLNQIGEPTRVDRTIDEPFLWEYEDDEVTGPYFYKACMDCDEARNLMMELNFSGHESGHQ